MGCYLSIRKRLILNSSNSAPTDNVQGPGISDSDAACREQQHSNTSWNQTKNLPSSPYCVTHMDESEDVIITSIRAMNVTLGPGHFPAGFYAVIHYSDLEWRTENKPLAANNNVVEWDALIPIPSDPSAIIYIEIYASFESKPVLGNGEKLRKLSVTVEQLLACCVRDTPLILSYENEDIAYSCSSISVVVKRGQNRRMSRILKPYRPSKSHIEIETATNEGHSFLSHYRKKGERKDLEHSIERFQLALDICPLDHPCLAAAQSNLANAKLILCCLDDADGLFDVPLTLYRNALAARPVGHPDRPSTLIQLAMVHLTRFEKHGDEAEEAQAQVLLHEAVELCGAESHQYRAANTMLQVHKGCRMGPIQLGNQLLEEQDEVPGLTHVDPLALSAQAVECFKKSGYLAYLQRAIIVLEAFVKSNPVQDDRYRVGLVDLGIALMDRFDHLGELRDLEEAICKHKEAVDLIPDDHPDKPDSLTNLGDALSTRFEHLGELRDLEQAVSIRGNVVELTTDGDPCKPARLSKLGNSFRVRFQRLGELGDLERALSSHMNATDLIPDGHPQRATFLADLGNSFRVRFQRFGEVNDLEQALSRHSIAVYLVPRGHPDQPRHLSNLGLSFNIRFDRLGERSDIEQAISSHSKAVELTSDGHTSKPVRVANLGNSFRARFMQYGDRCDLELAISNLMIAVDLTPDGHPHKATRLADVGTALFRRFLHFGEMSDLEGAISRHRNAIELVPPGHPDKPRHLSDLGVCLELHFQRFAELDILEQAILNHKNAIELTPDDHPNKPARLGMLGNSFRTRFGRLQELNDLENAISNHRNAVDLTPDDHLDKSHHLIDLGLSLDARFQRFGQLDDLEQAISNQRAGIASVPDQHPGKPVWLSTLGRSLWIRFQELGKLSDLEQAISTQTKAVSLIPDDHPFKHVCLALLGNCFLVRFEQIQELSDLEQAISYHRNAVDLVPHDHPDRPAHLGEFGVCFRGRFERLGELSDLEQAISSLSNAVDLTPDGHPGKHVWLVHLGSSVWARFQRFGKLTDLEQAISILKSAVTIIPDGLPQRHTCLAILSNSLRARFERLGDLSDLEQAISSLNKAVELVPLGHPNRPHFLGDLGFCFRARFLRLGELSDLEQAISSISSALDLIPAGHPGRPVWLAHHGNCLWARFQRLGKLSDIEQAISCQASAADLIPDDHPQKPIYLAVLGNSFQARFRWLGEPSDLERAVSNHRNSVSLVPDGHTDKAQRLSELGLCLEARFERLGELRDLEEAISIQTNAVELTPDGHPRKPTHLANLGNSFRARFQHLGELNDIEQAISSHKTAVDLVPHDHPEKPGRLRDLGLCFQVRSQKLGGVNDLEEAILSYTSAIELIPDGDPIKVNLLNELGNSFFTRFELLGQSDDVEQAISLCSRAASTTTGTTAVRFHASQQWVSCAQRIHHSSLLNAYSIAIGLLPQLAWIGLSLTHRYRELVQGADMVREAAAAALDSGLPETAVEWLEQGRSIVWGELLELRSSYEELSSVHPDHARRLQELSVALDHASATREKSLSSLHDPTESDTQQNAGRHRTLAIERDNLLQEIRGLPGFERFLLHKEFSQLRASAHSGPVVILNAAESRCDALIVRDDVDHVIHVPLSNFTVQRSMGFQNMLKNLLGHSRVLRSDDPGREGKSTIHNRISWTALLSTLWKGVVKPVLDTLDVTTPGDLARIFWCPTGPFVFLPIHAAGLYGTEYSKLGHKASDFVISSYVPTLSILGPSPSLDAAHSSGLHFLAVPQPASDGQPQLPGVEKELQHIRAVIRNSPSARTTLLESPGGTVEEVLELMKKADWVHFACHGVQDDASPTDSGLCLADGRRLRISDIIALSRPRGGLAFLSACQTAMGDEGLSDEAIHIAAGMLYAGYGGVVGTMWSISDKLAPRVARDVYGQLFRNGTTPDYQEAARALHEAVGRLRESGASFIEWLPFIHVGL